ncbi:hypothetical protein Q5P01_003037 [Channa striata]|uniref:Uncharacterized protein n=1 Tax=Channa striata TaxID=64152 RepID=A0AA88NSP4_CHASR|nr:hypothetical protein Q5P01_003037 [Channa striata]
MAAMAGGVGLMDPDTKEDNQDPVLIETRIKEENQDLFDSEMQEVKQDPDLFDQGHCGMGIKQENPDSDLVERDCLKNEIKGSLQYRTLEESSEPDFVDQERYVAETWTEEDQELDQQNTDPAGPSSQQSPDFTDVY